MISINDVGGNQDSVVYNSLDLCIYIEENRFLIGLGFFLKGSIFCFFYAFLC